MRPVQITHTRCDDYAGTTYAWCPDDMTEEQFQQAVDAATVEYLESLVRWQEERKKTMPTHEYQPPYDEFPDKTVAEVKEIHKKRKQAYADAEAVKGAAHAPFGSYLRKYGIVPWYEGEFSYTAEVYWGHRHGLSIEMSDERPSEDDVRLENEHQVRPLRLRAVAKRQ